MESKLEAKEPGKGATGPEVAAENRRHREEELESEIRSFEKEREKIRSIIGRIGGAPTNKVRIINIIFVIAVLSVFAASII